MAESGNILCVPSNIDMVWRKAESLWDFNPRAREREEGRALEDDDKLECRSVTGSDTTLEGN